nr:hypothetical protein BaRGS_004472 [Batillaria attramentaria]
MAVEDVNVEEANPSDREDAEDPEADYESLDKYENPNDIKPYHTLQIGERRHHLEQGQHTHLKVFADQVAADYQNITGDPILTSIKLS